MVPCFPLLGLTPSGLFMGLSSTLIYTSELILCSTICVPSATRHNIHMHPYMNIVVLRVSVEQWRQNSYYPVPQSATPLSAIATMTPLPSEDITPDMEGQIKEWLKNMDMYASGRLGARPLKIRLGPCYQLSTPFITLSMSLKRDFDSLEQCIISDCSTTTCC